MYINQIYKYEKDGIIYVGGNVPEDVTVLEIMNILNAEVGYDLIRISNNENVGTNIWLKDSDIKENYREEKQHDNSN